MARQTPSATAWSLSVLDPAIAGQLVRGTGGQMAPDDFGTFQLLGDGATDNSARCTALRDRRKKQAEKATG
jgi:hypothetical protein